MFSDITVLCNRPRCAVWALSAADDVVKVDATSILQCNKENSVPSSQENSLPSSHRATHCQEAAKQPSLEVLAFQAAMRERQEREEQREQARAQRDEERRRKRDRLEQERRELARRSEASREQERLELLRAEVQAAEDARKHAEEVAAAAEAERQQREAREKDVLLRAGEAKKTLEDRRKVDDFLALKGFTGVNSKRTRMLKSKYPLHSAVKERSAELVMLLLNARADATLKNSAGLTPVQVASKLDVGDSYSHAEILRVLQKAA
jgi:hypothetical protein